MVFSYGQGEFFQAQIHVRGEILLSEHKLYLRGPEGDLTQSYVPIEKIQKIKRINLGLQLFVRLSISESYIALIKGERKYIDDLIKDMVSFRGFKKRFLAQEWIDGSL